MAKIISFPEDQIKSENPRREILAAEQRELLRLKIVQVIGEEMAKSKSVLDFVDVLEILTDVANMDLVPLLKAMTSCRDDMKFPDA